MNYDFWEVYRFIQFENRFRNRPDLGIKEEELREYNHFVRGYKPQSLEEFIDFVKDTIEHFEERVEEESNLLREDYFEILNQLEKILPYDDEYLPEYYI
ncbi:MAG: hypothetical protein WC867_02390 [Candidatus Pacearchaeota archaeon]|jgi:hypothetical protein